MRRVIGLAALTAVWVIACSPSGSHNPVSKAAANAAALADIQSLARQQAEQATTPLIVGFAVMTDRLTRDTASVSDAQGHVLTVNPAPSQAWVVEITAPPQGIWGNISALAEVDSSSGAVAGTGLWAVPASAPVKPGS
jgi:CCR4-NOT transcriptional regulation complex NOT5 subunit